MCITKVDQGTTAFDLDGFRFAGAALKEFDARHR
jgi:hypothetical protein